MDAWLESYPGMYKTIARLSSRLPVREGRTGAGRSLVYITDIIVL